MKAKKISKIVFNWHTGEFGASSETYVINMEVKKTLPGEKKHNILRMEEHEPRGEGDKYWIDVFFDDKSEERIFNINRIEYKVEEIEEKLPF